MRYSRCLLNSAAGRSFGKLVRARRPPTAPAAAAAPAVATTAATSTGHSSGPSTAAAAAAASEAPAAAATTANSSAKAAPVTGGHSGNSGGNPQRHTPSAAALARLRTEDLHAEIVAVNRQPTLKHSPQRVKEVLTEVLSRVALVGSDAFRDAVVAAHHGGHHALGVQLFQKRAVSHLHDPHFALYDATVDSAAKVGADALVAAATAGVRRMQSFPTDHPTDIALGRTLWRAAAIDMHAEQASASFASSSSSRQTRKEDGGNRGSSSGGSCFARVWEVLSVNPPPGFRSVEMSVARRSLQRFVRYGAARDGGEMHALRWLVDRHLLHCAESKPLQLHVNLLRSCRPGGWSDEAARYFAAYAEGRAEYDEVAVHAYLHALQSAKDYTRIADFGDTALQKALQQQQEQGTSSSSSGGLSGAVLAIIAQAASELPRPAVVELVYRGAVERALAAAEGEGGPPQVSQYTVFSCLTAVGKCGAPDFMERLEYCRSAGLVDASDESWVYLVLQYAVYAIDPVAAAAPAMAKLEAEDGPAPTERIFNQLLQLMLRVDAPGLLQTYERATAAGFYRPQWQELLVTWADRRRYELTVDERRRVLRHVHARIPTGSGPLAATSPGLAGLRPMVALLLHDDAQARQQQHEGSSGSKKQNSAAASAPTADTPQLVDPRAYFLRTRRHFAVAPGRAAMPGAAAAAAVASGNSTPAATGASAGTATSASPPAAASTLSYFERVTLDGFLVRALAEMQARDRETAVGVLTVLKRRPPPMRLE